LVKIPIILIGSVAHIRCLADIQQMLIIDFTSQTNF